MAAMTPSSIRDFSQPVHATGAWSRTFRAWYRALRLIKAPLMWLATTHGFGNIVVLSVAGRRSGADHRLPLGLLRVGGRWYLGHPSGDTAWTLNLRAADSAAIESADIPAIRVQATILDPGSERDRVVRATFRQHPFPGDAIYRLAGRHVSDTGVFFRLEPAPASDSGGPRRGAG